jgi:hypothetical protein
MQDTNNHDDSVEGTNNLKEEANQESTVSSEPQKGKSKNPSPKTTSSKEKKGKKKTSSAKPKKSTKVAKTADIEAGPQTKETVNTLPEPKTQTESIESMLASKDQETLESPKNLGTNTTIEENKDIPDLWEEETPEGPSQIKVEIPKSKTNECSENIAKTPEKVKQNEKKKSKRSEISKLTTTKDKDLDPDLKQEVVKVKEDVVSKEKPETTENSVIAKKALEKDGSKINKKLKSKASVVLEASTNKKGKKPLAKTAKVKTTQEIPPTQNKEKETESKEISEDPSHPVEKKEETPTGKSLKPDKEKLKGLAKKLGIAVAVAVALIAAYIYGIPAVKNLYNQTMGIEKNEEKTLLMDNTPPQAKTEGSQTHDGISLKTEEHEDLTMEVVEKNKIAITKLPLEGEKLGNSSQGREGQGSGDYNQLTEILEDRTAWPREENKFVVVDTEIEAIEPSQVNPKKRYIKIIDPNLPQKSVVVETSTQALVKLLDSNDIKKGSQARITLSSPPSNLKEKYMEERKKIAKALGTKENDFFSIEEYEIRKDKNEL